MSLAETILATSDLKEEEITIEKWGGDFLVRELTAGQRERFEQLYVEQGSVDVKDLRASFIVDCFFTLEGKKIFDESHIEGLSKKSASIIDQIFDVCRRLSGIGDFEEQMEKAEGN